MHVLIVYCHPSQNSFTAQVKEAFIKGLTEAGHSHVLSDLYAMGFNPVFSEEEYQREAFYDETRAIPDDVAKEQAKVSKADALVLIYPVFWTEAPAMLVGWFQRVWTFGFAYGESTMKQLEKALFLVTMGGDLKEEMRKTQVEAMKTVMLGDRINVRAKASEMLVFDEMTREVGFSRRDEKMATFLEEAYQQGLGF